jgi:hypothetical protein
MPQLVGTVKIGVAACFRRIARGQLTAPCGARPDAWRPRESARAGFGPAARDPQN